MASKKHLVTLTAADRAPRHGIGHRGREAAYRRRRAQIQLQVDPGPAGPGHTDAATAERLSVHRHTGAHARRACAQEGLEAALQPPPLDPPRRARQLDGAAEARLSARACGPAPEGHAAWTMRLRQGRLVALESVDGIGWETVRTTLPKTRCRPGKCGTGACRGSRTVIASVPWNRCGTPTRAPWIPTIP